MRGDEDERKNKVKGEKLNRWENKRSEERYMKKNRGRKKEER